MGDTTTIQWTDRTFNPWIGCTKVSAECDRCYAERGSARLGAQRKLKLWQGDHYFVGDDYWKKPLKWNRDVARDGGHCQVFCASYADVLEDVAELEATRKRLATLIEATPNLDWLLLTKRPENGLRLLGPMWGTSSWPRNVWMGTTVGINASVGRVDHLLALPSAIHFVSYEPALESVRFGPWMVEWRSTVAAQTLAGAPAVLRPKLDWLIVGGESGPGARPFDVQWAWDAIADCKAAGVACFVKQLGAHVRWNGMSNPGEHWPSGVTSEDDLRGGFRMRLKDSHGGDMAEWPEALRVREWPMVGAR